MNSKIKTTMIILLNITLLTGSMYGLNEYYKNQEYKNATEQLTDINDNIERLHKEENIARREAKNQQCIASQYRLESSLYREESICYKQIAKYYACEAINREDEQVGGMIGLLGGALLATVTGGSSLLLIGGGALGGSAMSGNEYCEKPQCSLNCNLLLEEILKKEKLSQIPQCQGINPFKCPEIKNAKR